MNRLYDACKPKQSKLHSKNSSNNFVGRSPTWQSWIQKDRDVTHTIVQLNG